MKQSKQFLIFGLLAGVTLGVLASSPTIYAIVEPHITINMEPSQTTKPFQINDDQGDKVFSVVPDGGIDGVTTQLVYEADGPINVSTPQPASTIIAKWQITKPAGALDAQVLSIISGVSYAEMQVTSGTEFVRISLETSADDVTYFIEDFSAGSFSTTNQAVFGADEFLTAPGDTRFLAISTQTGDASTTGVIQNIKIYYELILPHGWTIERIL